MDNNVRSGLIVVAALGVYTAITFLDNRQFHNQAFSGIVDSWYRGAKTKTFFIVIGRHSHDCDVVSLSAAPPIDQIIAKGDSIYKKQNTDTVTLVHQKKYVFKYILNKGILGVTSK
jgi:hypothetical protein